jgi:hypothetical protein
MKFRLETSGVPMALRTLPPIPQGKGMEAKE